MPDTLQDAPRCSCERQQIRRRKQRNGVVVIGAQCLQCGRMCERATKNNYSLPSLPWWDDALAQRWREKVDAYYGQRRQEYLRRQSDQDAAWRKKWEDHMASTEWQILRQKVFKRCNGMCEGCNERRAVQVHHLTYDRLGHEMLFDLVAVCLACHASIHPHHHEGDEEDDL